jgi:hypothetical protein
MELIDFFFFFRNASGSLSRFHMKVHMQKSYILSENNEVSFSKDEKNPTLINSVSQILHLTKQ